MLSLHVAPYRLPLAAPFATAAGAIEHRDGLLVRLLDEATGEAGFGEVAPLPGHGGEPLDAARGALAQMAAGGAVDEAALLVAASPDGLDPSRPCAHAGLALALCDLLARRAGQPLSRWLAPDARQAVAVNATIGSVSPAEAARRADDALHAGYRTLKIKVGDAGGTPRVAAVRQAVRAAEASARAVRERIEGRANPAQEHVGDLATTSAHAVGMTAHAVRLRADANGAWEASSAPAELAALAEAADRAIELVEQPVPAQAVDDLAALRRLAIVPVAADEALERPGGWQRVLAAGAADVLIVKPTLVGGPLAAMAIAAAARAEGVGIVVTTALDGAVGRAGALHVAAALPALAGACGLATGGLLAGDVADGAVPVRGWMAVPARPGLGLEPRRDGSGAPLAWQRP